MTLGAATRELLRVLPAQEGMPAGDCTSILDEGREGPWYMLAVHTSDRCAPEAQDTLNGRFVVNASDGRVMRCQSDNCIGGGGHGEGVPIAAGGYVEVADLPLEVADIVAWQHPTKAVFSEFGVELSRVTLTEHGTFATFDVTLRPLLPTEQDSRWIRGLYDRVCGANFGFSFALQDRRSGVRSSVECSGSTAVGGSGLGW